MTLVKWNPTRSLITDFDQMLDGIAQWVHFWRASAVDQAALLAATS